MRRLSVFALRSLSGGRLQPRLERLEDRRLLAASLSAEHSLSVSVCHCPICTGEGLAAPTASGTASTSPSAAVPISNVPQLSSNPTAGAKLFLDFNGHFESSWGGRTNVVTPAYDTDGDTSTFSDAELSNISQIWARVVEDYAPFNIDVTTIDPGYVAEREVAVVAIGGSSSDWYGSSAGGVAFVGGFYNSASNVAYAFENNLGNGNPKYTSEAVAHEAGHLFGLSHQALWNGNTLVTAYNQGDSAWAPIMGVGYYSTRTTWYNGPTSAGPTAYQDDIAILSGVNNGFGLRPDDFGNTAAAATAIPASGTSVDFGGLLTRHDDVDAWQFTTTGGVASIALSVAAAGPDLDGILELRDSNGNPVASSNPTTSFNASINVVLSSGSYVLFARSDGTYGNMGQYTISGTLEGINQDPPPPPPNPPEISVQASGQDFVSGGSIDFGQVPLGSSVTKTVTIQNIGGGTLSLSPIDANGMPSGFTLVSNLSSLQLAAGESTSFVVKFGSNVPGDYSGAIQLSSNDSDEGTYLFNLQGKATSSASIIDDSSSGWTKSGPWKQLMGSGYANDHYELTKLNSSQTATWTFNALSAGQYRVWATWTGGSANTTAARFSASEGGSTLASWLVSQRLAPSGLTADGANWTELGVATISGNELVVRLACHGAR